MKLEHNYDKCHGWKRRMAEHGYGHESLESIYIRFEYTPEQQEANRAFAESHTDEEWFESCLKEERRRSEYIRPVMEAIAAEVKCYQFDSEADRSMPYAEYGWDLYFFCLHLMHDEFGFKSRDRDYSHIVLSFNEYHTPEQQMDVLRRVEAVLARFSDCENLSVKVCHEISLHAEAIRRAADILRPMLDGKAVTYSGSTNDVFRVAPMDGKLKYHEGVLYFMKKRARTRGYLLNDNDVLCMAFDLGITLDD